MHSIAFMGLHALNLVLLEMQHGPINGCTGPSEECWLQGSKLVAMVGKGWGLQRDREGKVLRSQPLTDRTSGDDTD